MEDSYKVDLLKNLEPFSELLVYDWSNGGDTELVVEDIEKIGKLSTIIIYGISFRPYIWLKSDSIFPFIE